MRKGHMAKIYSAQWMEDARNSAGLTQSELADRIGLSQDKISNVKRGVRKLSSDEATRISEVTGYPLPGHINPLDVLGYIGAGAVVYPIDDGDPLYSLNIEYPLPPGTVGAIVRGDSMFPIFEDGDLVAYSGETVLPEDMIGETCIVQVTDGRMLIKTIRRGSLPGLYTLTSYNAPDIVDVSLDWARSFYSRISRRVWRKFVR